MNGPRRDHPDMRADAPGRIPESLIDAAMDGELDPEIQKEIGKALQYDPARRQEFHDTRDALNALRMPIETPDLSDRVLQRAHRHRRFIPNRLRRQVRAGRVVMAAFLLTAMLSVASLQRAFPRLTTLGAQQTPVANIEQAVEHGGQQIAQTLSSELRIVQECVAEPVRGILAGTVQRPGADQSYTYTVRVMTGSASAAPQPAIHYPFPRGSYTLANLAYQVPQAPLSAREAAGFAQIGHQPDTVLTTWVAAPRPVSAPRSVEEIDEAIELP